MLFVRKLSRKTAEETTKAMIEISRSIPKSFQKTTTLDNGPEFTGHEKVSKKTGLQIYFARPYHSWERGTSENTNGLIRQYIPRGTSMAKLTQWLCNAIARRLNRRPRKVLGLDTPEQAHLAMQRAA